MSWDTGEGDLISATKNTVTTGLRSNGRDQSFWSREDVLAFIDPVKMNTMLHINTVPQYSVLLAQIVGTSEVANMCSRKI